ncbi:MAG: heat-inducible transcriptional repressor HrcA [Nitrospinaceae bacterium]
MKPPELDPRARAILLETINEYILSAEPVGSRTLSGKLTEGWSPATVRHAMAELEEMGFLSQPHTSAGRVPTDQGYRYYVDEILQRRPGPKTLRKPEGGWSFPEKESSLQETLGSACSLLSARTQQPSLITAPSLGNLHLKRIEFIRLAEKQILAVFISNLGAVQNRMLHLEEDLPQERLTSVANFLNTEFAGRPLLSIRAELRRRLKNDQARYRKLFKKALDLWGRVFADEDQAQLLVEGLNHLLDQPEFEGDLQRMKALFRTVEERRKLVKLLDLCMQQEGTSVIIGEEHLLKEMRGCSLIAQIYSVDDNTLGALAILGPKRMDYGKMIHIVQTSAANVSQYLSLKSG